MSAIGRLLILDVADRGEAAAFWAESNELARKTQADPLITYMHLMYKKAKQRGVRIDREELVALGRQVELFPGVEAWFDEIEQYVAQVRALFSEDPLFIGQDDSQFCSWYDLAQD